MITKKNKEFSYEVFDSVTEFINVSETRPNDGRLGNCSHDTYDADWYGTNDFDEAQGLLKNGYKDGLKDLLNTASTVKTINPQHKSAFKAGVVGFAPIVPNAIKGIPQAMITKRRLESKNKTISLIYDFGAGCHVSSDTILRGGKNMFSLIQSLENKGYRVEFNIFNGVTSSTAKNKCGVLIKLKSYTMPLNPQLISYPIIHTSFFRRHIFSWRETSPIYKLNNYGYTLRYKVNDIKGFLKAQGILKDNTYYLNVEEAARCNSIDDMFYLLGIKK